MRAALLSLLLLGLCGCDGGGAEEEKAAKELAPKPMTEEQRRAMEDVKAKFPNAAQAAPGR